MRVHILRYSLLSQNLSGAGLAKHNEIILSKNILEKTNSIIEFTNKKDFIISIKYSS
jgi:hypothetical protein